MTDVSDRPPTRHLGLDLGGTNIKWAVVDHDGDRWTVVERDQVATQMSDGPDAVVRRLADVGAEAIRRAPGVQSVGIGVPGLYDPAAGTLRFLVNFPGGWGGTPVASPVGEALGLPAFLINDARAFGLAELRLGAGRGASSMIGLTLGTGVGGVVAVDGRVLQGHDGTAGEIGHQTIEPDGPWCGCGNRGCLEAFARADQIAANCGTATAEEAFARARAGDARAIDGLARIGRYLGIGIGNMIVVIAPDRVVIGGGVSAAADLLLGSIRDEIRRRVLTTSLEMVEIVVAELGTWAGSIGAAVHGAEAVREHDAAAAAAVGA
ncbi:MAG TPA: ROK family protein [Candidatus Limnocylindrales bacterium]|nr:ROK family protein [Candidatus Limnocylindrales bacterium]